MADVVLSPRVDQLRYFISELARPFAIVATSGGAAVASVIIAMKVDDFANAALFIGAVYTGVGALYAAKSWELVGQAKQSANVEIAKAATPTVSP